MSERITESDYTVSTEGCWESTWSISPDGYGYRHNPAIKRQELAHRVSFEQHHGEIPSDMVVDHVCNNKRCVNPEHLRLLDPLDNLNRTRREQTHCKRNHPLSGDNVLLNSGRRHCRACRSENGKRRYLARLAAAAKRACRCGCGELVPVNHPTHRREHAGWRPGHWGRGDAQ